MTSASVFPSTQRPANVTRFNCTHLSIRLHVPDLLDLGVARMRNNALLFFQRRRPGLDTTGPGVGLQRSNMPREGARTHTAAGAFLDFWRVRSSGLSCIYCSVTLSGQVKSLDLTQRGLLQLRAKVASPFTSQ